MDCRADKLPKRATVLNKYAYAVRSSHYKPAASTRGAVARFDAPFSKDSRPFVARILPKSRVLVLENEAGKLPFNIAITVLRSANSFLRCVTRGLFYCSSRYLALTSLKHCDYSAPLPPNLLICEDS